MAAQPQLRAARAAVRVGGGRPPACPLCGQWNVKENGNNNIRYGVVLCEALRCCACCRAELGLRWFVRLKRR